MLTLNVILCVRVWVLLVLINVIQEHHRKIW